MPDSVDLKDDGQAEFVITKDGQPADYADVLELTLDEDADAATAAFRMTCKKCGAVECRVDDRMKMGSSWTGAYGSIDIECQKCGAYRSIYDA